MKTRVYATDIFCSRAILATMGMVLLLSGCGQQLNASSPVQPTSASTVESDLHQSQKKDYIETQSIAEAEPTIPESANSVVATVEKEQLTLSTKQLPAGKVQFQINNLEVETLDVLILQTDLPVEAIPIKDSRVDFSTGTVKLVAKLDNSPIPILGSDIIFCDLEPGNYVVMVYPTGKIYNAMKQIITVTATDAI
jgi:hypothetical protein